MFKEIYKKIKKYDTIVIARHIGVDPDAMASQIGLRDSIRLTFPGKKVLAVGTGSAKFRFIGNLDKLEKVKDALLIITDTPDKKRVDISSLEGFAEMIKIDHHPFIEKFCDLEYIEDTASSAAQIIMELIKDTKLECNSEIAKTLFIGLAADSNRFLFNSCTSKTFALVSYYLDKYPFNMNEVYQQLYKRPLAEVRLEGYISSNIKNDIIRISIRSRGPEINTVAEKFNGGGHKFASGAKVKSFEDAMKLMEALDLKTKEYKVELERDE